MEFHRSPAQKQNAHTPQPILQSSHRLSDNRVPMTENRLQPMQGIQFGHSFATIPVTRSGGYSALQARSDMGFGAIVSNPNTVIQRQINKNGDMDKEQRIKMLSTPPPLATEAPKSTLPRTDFSQTREPQHNAAGNAGRSVPGAIAAGGANRTGLPNRLKVGAENLSGVSMDDVRVHHNSSKPAQLNALAYAQGTEIHVAPGQSEQLPHEAWHIVQQRQNRVPKGKQPVGIPLNDDPTLEREADIKGKRLMQQDGGLERRKREQ